jgi:cell division cycle protein 20 (cofactor of APC complex)
LHGERIGCVEWNPKIPTLIATGSKDKTIKLIDIRINKKIALAKQSHEGEICGLSWNQNGYHLASGGNDNLINVWDLRNIKQNPTTIKEHTAAVRALKWCPWNNNLLASGGGSGDMRLLVHNVDKNQVVKNISTTSQVCAVDWDYESRSLLTAHGFSKFQMCIWDYET